MGAIVQPGVVLQDRYEIVGTLGAGGQATVFEAVDRRLGIHVAVKHSVEQRPNWREAFVREARLLASLRHPSLPMVSDHFVEAEGQYLVLELVPGDDLEAHVGGQGRPCTVDEVLPWADQLLDALAYLHGQSPPIIHRDIKPRNLKVRADGRLVLLDFGLAKGRPSQDDEHGVLVSMRGYSHGYAPLEQMLPEGTDARSDLYGVGATLYYLLSGKVPPDATTRDFERMMRGDPIRPLESLNPDVPGLVGGLIHRALELQAERRFQSAAEMRRAFTAAAASLAGPTTAPVPVVRLSDDEPFSEPPTVIPPPPVRVTIAPVVDDEDAGDDGAERVVGPARGGDAASPSRPPLSPQVPDAPEPPAPSSSRLAAGYQLALAHGDQPADRWVLATDRPNTIGRSGSSEAPDVDLWPDRRASRVHARIWYADHLWWIEDVGSRHGTRLDGRALTPGQAVVVRPWSEIELGETTLFLAPPGWRRTRGRDLVLDLEVAGAVSSSLLHAGLPIVRRIVARSRARTARPAGRVELALDPCFGPIAATVPPLAPGKSATLKLPPIVPSYDVLEGQIERARRRLTITLDGAVLRGEPIECWLLPHNEWSTLPEHQRALAAFVLPNHPDVGATVLEVTATVDPNAPAEDLLAGLFDTLAERWQLTYRLEPPHWSADSQKVRLPHQVLLDDAGRHGEGTCLDLVLLVAACLENLGLQPLVAILDLGEWWHALVGCWDPPEPGLESLRFDAGTLLDRAIWIDPTCATRDGEIRRPFAEARAVAERCLRERPLLFALDVTAARREEIMPLPFAGVPTWSAGATRAIDAAQAHARVAGGQLCSAALLAGLLTAGDGLTSDLIGASLGDPVGRRPDGRRGAAALAAGAPGQPRLPPGAGRRPLPGEGGRLAGRPGGPLARGVVGDA